VAPARIDNKHQTPARSHQARLIALAVLAFLYPASASETEPAPKPQTPPVNPLSRPSVRIVRDPRVQAELRITPGQARRIEALLDDADGPLWRLRDAPTDKSRQEIEATLRS
jgi:hypothetical protein